MARIEIAKKTDLDGKSDINHTHSYEAITGKPNIPSNTSHLTNDSGFITNSDLPTVPTNNSELENGANYITGNYDNSSSGLTATTIQEAIDELKAMLDSMNQG